MGWLMTASLREPYVCETACTHLDCESARATVAQPCCYCEQPIGEEARYMGITTDPTVMTGALAHVACAWEREDARRVTRQEGQ